MSDMYTCHLPKPLMAVGCLLDTLPLRRGGHWIKRRGRSCDPADGVDLSAPVGEVAA